MMLDIWQIFFKIEFLLLFLHCFMIPMDSKQSSEMQINNVSSY